jgi:hypothetical protein
MIQQLVHNNTCVLHVVAYHPERIILMKVAMHTCMTSIIATFHCKIFLLDTKVLKTLYVNIAQLVIASCRHCLSGYNALTEMLFGWYSHAESCPSFTLSIVEKSWFHELGIGGSAGSSYLSESDKLISSRSPSTSSSSICCCKTSSSSSQYILPPKSSLDTPDAWLLCPFSYPLPLAYDMDTTGRWLGSLLCHEPYSIAWLLWLSLPSPSTGFGFATNRETGGVPLRPHPFN